MQGYAFCEYVDSTVTNRVISELKQRRINKRPLTVNRALPDLPQPPQQSTAPQSEATHAILQPGVPELSAQSMTPGAAQPQPTLQSMPQSMPQSQSQLSMQSMTQSLPQPQLSMQGVPQSQHSMQSMTQGLPRPQHSTQSVTQGFSRPQHSTQSMTQGLPQSQHSMQSTTQGLPQHLHSMQSMTPGMHQSQLRGRPQITSHPGPIQSPQMAAQGSRPFQGVYYTQPRSYPRGTQAQHRPSGGNPQQ